MTTPTGTAVVAAVRNQRSVTIPNGAAITGDIDLGSETLAGIVVPASWTAANLTFQASADGVTYSNLFDGFGVEVTASAAASRFIALNAADFAGVRALRVRSGTSGTPVNQGADRVLTLVSLR